MKKALPWRTLALQMDSWSYFDVAGIEAALRNALNAEAAAQAEAKRWRAQAEDWRQRYEQQVQQVQHLRSQSKVSAGGTTDARDGGVSACAGSGSILEPCNELTSDADTDALPTVRLAADTPRVPVKSVGI